MIRLHHISLKTNNINILKKFYIYMFNAKIVHKFQNGKINYGYFLLLGKNTFIEILKNKGKKINHYNENNSLNHFCILAGKDYKKILKKCRKKKILYGDEIKGKTDKTLHFKFFDPDKNLCEIFYYNDKQTIFRKYNLLK